MSMNVRDGFPRVSGYHLVLGISMLLLQAGCELNQDGSLVIDGPLQSHAEAFKDLPDLTDAELIDYYHRLRARLNNPDSSDDLDLEPFRDGQPFRIRSSHDDNSEMRSISEKLAEVQAEMDSRKLKVP